MGLRSSDEGPHMNYCIFGCGKHYGHSGPCLDGVYRVVVVGDQSRTRYSGNIDLSQVEQILSHLGESPMTVAEQRAVLEALARVLRREEITDARVSSSRWDGR